MAKAMKIRACSRYIHRAGARDPVLDIVNDVVERSGMTANAIAKAGGASAGTTLKQKRGETRYPTHRTIAANAAVAGYDFVLLNKKTGEIVRRSETGNIIRRKG